MQKHSEQGPEREIRAVYSERTIRVYQAYSPIIAEPALAAGTFVAPFKMDRMTWIKPSFLWMMYRSNWASSQDQERVLAVDISREGFEWCLDNCCLSSFQQTLHSSHSEWKETVRRAPVRVQWDPERDLHLSRMQHRAIQIGLRGTAVNDYVNEWVVGLEDVTPLCAEIRRLINDNALVQARQLLPPEKPYPVSESAALRIGATPIPKTHRRLGATASHTQGSSDV